MTTAREPGEHPDEEPVIVLDFEAIRRITKRRARVWFAVWLPLFLAFVAIGLFLMPQSYSSRVSISIQQNQSSMGMLSGLPLLGGGASKKYIGVLKSNRICGQVSKVAGIRELYGLRTEDDAVELTSRSVVADDNPIDGLLYINVTLAGPSTLAPGAGGRREQVKEAARTAADTFADELRRYMVYQDNDRDTVLLRAAKQQLARAQSDYNSAVIRLANFVKQTKMNGAGIPIAVPSGTGSSVGTDAGASSRGGSTPDSGTPITAAALLQQLYLERGRVETELRSLEKAEEKRMELTREQLDNPAKLPTEDILLMQARNRVISARADLQNLLIEYGDSAPAVRAARAKVNNYEKRLKEEAETVKHGLLTEHVLVESQRKGLETKLAIILQQITNAEKDLQLNRVMTTDFEVLRNAVTLRLEILKTTATQSAVLGVQTVSAQSRMIVVDSARKAKLGKPGKLLIGLGSLALSSIVICGWFMVDYTLRKH